MENIQNHDEPCLKTHFHDFLRNNILKPMVKKLSHDSLQRVYKQKVEVKGDNKKYKKQELDQKFVDELDQKMATVIENVINDIDEFNVKIKLDNSYYERLFRFREGKKNVREYREKQKELIEKMNHSYTKFEKLIPNND